MREIAIRAGRGNISSSTVHNLFRSSRVPRWAFLEQVVKALGGGQERDAFLALWQAAWRAENDVAAPRRPRPTAPPAGTAPTTVRLTRAAAAAGRRRRPDDATPRPAQRIWSNEIPSRNPNFTGRAAELELMSDNLFSQQPPHVQVIAGMGGIGKTELATEYIHRNIDNYEIIWWIRAEHHDRVRDALVKLAQRLELRQATTDSGRDRTIAAVLDTLQSAPFSSWLLVFDNAANPLDLQKYLPAGSAGGARHHYLPTAELAQLHRRGQHRDLAVHRSTRRSASCDARCSGLAEGDGLAEEEDARRASEARRLATNLGHLPIAIDHAAAYLAETGQSVDEYLTRFAENAHQLLSEQPRDPISRPRSRAPGRCRPRS